MIGKTTSHRSPGWWIPWTFAAGFLLVVAVNGVMIWLAASTWTGLVTERAYDRGLEYNRNLEAAARMAQLGWQTRLTVATLADGARELRLEARDRTGEPLAGLWSRASSSGRCTREPTANSSLCPPAAACIALCSRICRPANGTRICA